MNSTIGRMAGHCSAERSVYMQFIELRQDELMHNWQPVVASNQVRNLDSCQHLPFAVAANRTIRDTPILVEMSVCYEALQEIGHFGVNEDA